MNFDEGAEARLDAERRTLHQERNKYSGDIDKFEAIYHYLQYKYIDPMPNFDRSKVKGMVAKLFRMREESYATALEVANIKQGFYLNYILPRSRPAAKSIT